jgi:hypothetical protein
MTTTRPCTRTGTGTRAELGGPVLSPNQLLNLYTGRANPGLLRIIVRADPRVRQLRFRSQRGERCDIQPVADDVETGVTFLASCFVGNRTCLTPGTGR